MAMTSAVSSATPLSDIVRPIRCGRAWILHSIGSGLVRKRWFDSVGSGLIKRNGGSAMNQLRENPDLAKELEARQLDLLTDGLIGRNWEQFDKSRGRSGKSVRG